MANLDTIYTITSDHLRLPGIHYVPQSADTCVLMVHGMSGNILENYAFDVLGKTLAANNIAAIYSHNRGYNFVNDIRIMTKIKPDNSYETQRIGVVYERFAESELDIDAWVNSTLQLGYKKIILLGHSLGTNKVVHYMHKHHPSSVVGVVLASPPDMVGQIKVPYPDKWESLLSQAQQLLASNHGRDLLPFNLWEWYQLSAQTFVDLFTDNGPADNLPILRNPPEFPQLAAITVPILALVGEHDDIVIRSLQSDLVVIKSKATNCPNFTQAIIPGASHVYDNREAEFSQVVLNWVQSNL